MVNDRRIHWHAGRLQRAECRRRTRRIWFRISFNEQIDDVARLPLPVRHLLEKIVFAIHTSVACVAFLQ